MVHLLHLHHHFLEPLAALGGLLVLADLVFLVPPVVLWALVLRLFHLFPEVLLVLVPLVGRLVLVFLHCLHNFLWLHLVRQ